MNSKVKNIRDLRRGMNSFKVTYQPSPNIVIDENDALFANSHNILKRWKTHFSQIFSENGVKGVWQTEMHIVEPLVPQPCPFESVLCMNMSCASCFLSRSEDPDQTNRNKFTLLLNLPDHPNKSEHHDGLHPILINIYFLVFRSFQVEKTQTP
jgi:hypothetical protein